MTIENDSLHWRYLKFTKKYFISKIEQYSTSLQSIQVRQEVQHYCCEVKQKNTLFNGKDWKKSVQNEFRVGIYLNKYQQYLYKSHAIAQSYCGPSFGNIHDTLLLLKGCTHSKEG